MGGFVCLRKGLLKNVLAASVLTLLAGCTTLPAAPRASPVPAPASQPAAQMPFPPSSAPSPEAVAEPPADGAAQSSASPSRLAAFTRRLLGKRAAPVAQPAEPVAVAQAEQPKPEKAVDEKYRLTGEAALELERGHASWYGSRFHGRRTASGETYDKYALTAAHKTLPFGTIVRVRSLTLGREVNVRINDRGPFAPGRVIDVSEAAAEALGLTSAGVARVSLNVADSASEDAPASRPGKKTRASAAASKRSVSRDKRGASASAAKRSAPAAKRSAPAAKRKAPAAKRKAPAAKRKAPAAKRR
ncbi:MAG: septal ring lytic transglycosylase RlpA family protein [Pseudomonadota bacterium]|nr:septal ring lytic transglycosylase RlpA family protein [Pseudomonadota bacterium]